MRLIGTIPNIQQGKNFSNFLIKQGIDNKCDVHSTGCRIWIEEEDLVETARFWFQKWERNPNDPLFQPKTPPPPPHPEKQVRVEAPLSKEPLGKLNFLILILCGLIFYAGNLTSPTREPIPNFIPPVPVFSSPVKKALLYDYPYAYTLIDKITQTYGVKSLENPNTLPPRGKRLLLEFEKTPFWQGVYDKTVDYFLSIPTKTAPLFEKISQGQIWRLFTPALLHADIFHLVFNMIWLIIIGKQMEKRLGVARYLLFIILTAIFSNTSQYLMSGSNFIGFSGVLCAMVFFVRARQKRMPWEGYFLQPATWTFFVFFIFLMFAIQLTSFLLEITLHTSLPANIANTAHLSGAFLGFILGRLNFFSASYR